MPHDLGGLTDIRFAESDADGRGDHQELGVEFAVVRIAFGCQLDKLRAPVLWIVDEFDEALGRKLIRQPLHALTAGGSHLGDLRHGQRTKHGEASHEAERTAAPTSDEPCLLAKSSYPKEALGHFEHQFGDRLGFAVNDRACPRPSAHLGRVSCRSHRLRFLCLPYLQQSPQLTPLLSTSKMTPWLSFLGRLSAFVAASIRGADMETNSAGRQVTDTRTPGVIARPPILFLAALLLGFVLDHLLPLPFPVARIGSIHWISAIIAGSLTLTGIAVFAAGIRNFSSAATPVQGTKPTRTLVTTGIHGWSRNPIYIGMFLVYGAIGLAVRSPWILILALALAVAIRYGVVAREEAYLERRFGDAYRDYKARVRRWL